MSDLQSMGAAARRAGRRLATCPTAAKNAALLAVADAIEAGAADVLEANRQDVDAARQRGRSDSLLDRLKLDEKRIAALAADTRHVATLPDPVGAELESRLLPNGMRLSRRRVPIGVLGVIYEARPNVTIDVAALCLKTGNAAILRGGAETLQSNLALVRTIRQALEASGLPPEAVQYIENPDRALISRLLRLDAYVDMIIPRGGAGLHQLCKEESTIPVITGGLGICHIYVDASADLTRAIDIIENAKVQRPSVCNALDTLLVHPEAARSLLPPLYDRLAAHRVVFKADDAAMNLLGEAGRRENVEPAGPEDFDQEWLSLVLGVKIVGGLDEAIRHIQDHSTAHSDSILTNTWSHAQRFIDEVDSAAVYVNASTRFTDGGQFGLGAEVAVSTQKLHARGPMGLEELTTYKWIGIGDGHIRA